ncbi:hypothetical protein SteCoe_2074 [Stentor coeruleus]|uniref:Uncharacterized protein n=1 Tax=Stentor coeruleus TaxID=5963 RepID=A0A1R2D0H6_9CILI|nr:hypothetical protein SteCoe_2074 [Stentor coeruleus]
MLIPFHPKFSNVLLGSVPLKKLSNVVSYSALLNCQRDEIALESPKKRQITTYHPQSRIFQSMNNAISLKKIEFAEGVNLQRKKIIFSKPKQVYRHNSQKLHEPRGELKISCKKLNLIEGKRCE